ncbi:hypothetical protein B9Q03_02400 [Candidatus Marsarchaeota G2 archaeon OSP_D]|jgi:hypothetical protein|uniref:PsbP C-terminal domain-containing protein n=2 Tax=Candidatus Marsarchaeota group 2 TaxID=2203771 RepID=A0A2R6B0I3_9ARCH|nr:MAG: hypothetical protein B9Q03_02400 [Candidatus Marsarchaeota G2 archaeon OSP_D]
MMMLALRFDLYSAYGLSILYPASWRVELNPASKRQEGDVVFHSPEKDKLYVSWGPLEKARQKFEGVEKHAEYSVERIKRSKDVNGFEISETRRSNLNGHEAVFNAVKFGVSPPGMFGFKGKPSPKRVYSMHLYCEDSSRYLVVYTLCSEEGSEQILEVTKKCIDSLKCHNEAVDL